MMKILVVKPSSLGDIIHALPFLKAVKETFKNCSVDWVVSKNLKDILEGNPLIDSLIVIDKDSWKRLKNLPGTVREIKGLIRTLKAGPYDMVIDLQGLLRSGLITFFANSPVKIGFRQARECSPFFYNRKVSVNKNMHAVDRCLEIAKEMQKEQRQEARGQDEKSRVKRRGRHVAFRRGDLIPLRESEVEFPLYIDNTAKENIKKLLGGLNEKEYVVIVPSARWETKRWPAENFGTLVSRLSVPCVITGGSKDSKITEQVMASSNNKGLNLCGKTNLKELIALMSGAKAVVSNDSGPMHIAAALGVPVIGLFGPTDPVKTGPYGWQDNRKFKVLTSQVPCSPCFKKKCKDPVCMTKINVETVLEEIEEYL